MTSIIVTCFLTLASMTAQGHELRALFAIGEWPPYVSENLPGKGMASELVAAICREGGIEAEFQFYPWPRAEAMVAGGEVFASFPYAMTDERRKAFDFSSPLFYTQSVLVYYAKNTRTLKAVPYDKPGDLRGYSVGAVAGDWQVEALRKAGVRVDTAPTIDQCIQKLRLGRVDLVAEESVVAFDAVTRLYPDEAASFRALGKGMGERIEAALLVSRNHPKAAELLKAFHEGLVKLKKSGKYDTFIDKYKMAK